LRPSGWHLSIVLILGALASWLAVRGCLDYNEVAGTDLTPRHIARIGLATLAGPAVGPVANPAAGEAPQARQWTAILLGTWFVSACPFLFVRRVVPWWVALSSWALFVTATLLWYFGAMISFGVFLS
jgi:hypothetical protein